VDYRITRHSGFGAPENALDLLLQQLGARQQEFSFSQGRAEIRARWHVDLPVSMERDEHERLGRTTLLEIVLDACRRAPDLNTDWFAVSPHR
jgi:hypothetical protein